MLLLLILACTSPEDTGEVPLCASTDLWDGEACVPIGCGVDRFRDLEADGYVDSSVPAGGDGSREQPYASISEAMAAGAHELVLAAGVYAESVVLTEDVSVSIRGRCPELVSITPTEEGALGVHLDAGPEAELSLSYLRIVDSPFIGVATDGGTLSLRYVDVVGATGVGVAAESEDALLSLDHVRVAETRLYEGGYGQGIMANLGGWVQGDTVRLELNHGAGAFASGEGSVVSLATASVYQTQPQADGTDGVGLFAQQGGSVDCSSCFLWGNHHAGVLAIADATVGLSDSLIEDTQGVGVAVMEGGRAELERCTVRRSAGLGIHATGAGSSVELVGTEVTDTLPNDEGAFGRGVSVQEGARASLEGCEVLRNPEVGVAVTGRGSELVVVDSLVADTLGKADGAAGFGVYAVSDASASLSRTDVTGNLMAGVLSAWGAVTSLEDVQIIGTLRTARYNTAIGVGANGGTVEADGLLVSDTGGPGLFVVLGGEMHCTGCVVDQSTFSDAVVYMGSLELVESSLHGAAPDPSEGGGLGVYANDLWGLPEVMVDSSEVRGEVAGLWLEGEGSYVITDSILHGGAGQDSGAGWAFHGDAVVARDGVTQRAGEEGLSIERTRLADAGGSGLFLHQASATLRDCEFADNQTDLVWQHTDGVLSPQVDITDLDALMDPERERPVLELQFVLELEDLDPVD